MHHKRLWPQKCMSNAWKVLQFLFALCSLKINTKDELLHAQQFVANLYLMFWDGHQLNLLESQVLQVFKWEYHF